MSKVSIYLNFTRHTEAAFLFYQSIFGGEFDGGFRRFSDMPPMDGMPPMQEADLNLVMHVALPIFGGSFVLMGTDAPESMGFVVNPGNNMYINMELDTREETRRLFDGLSEGGVVETELQEMFWGAYFGSCTDRFGIRWMFNCEEKH